MFRYFYVGQLKDDGDLEELTGVVATQLKGNNIKVIQIKKGAPCEEVLQKLRAFWAFIASLQPGYRENVVKNISTSGKIPTAILCFDSSLSPDTLHVPSPPYGFERMEMLEFFAKEADFIGFIPLEYR